MNTCESDNQGATAPGSHTYLVRTYILIHSRNNLLLRFRDPRGIRKSRRKLLDAHPELNPEGDTLQRVCTSASREGDCVLLGTSHLVGWDVGRFEAQNGAHDVWLSDES